MYLFVISASSLETRTALGSTIEVYEVCCKTDGDMKVPLGDTRIFGLLILGLWAPPSGYSANLRLQSYSVRSMAKTADDGSSPRIGLQSPLVGSALSDVAPGGSPPSIFSGVGAYSESGFSRRSLDRMWPMFWNCFS